MKAVAYRMGLKRTQAILAALFAALGLAHILPTAPDFRFHQDIHSELIWLTSSTWVFASVFFPWFRRRLKAQGPASAILSAGLCLLFLTFVFWRTPAGLNYESAVALATGMPVILVTVRTLSLKWFRKLSFMLLPGLLISLSGTLLGLYKGTWTGPDSAFFWASTFLPSFALSLVVLPRISMLLHGSGSAARIVRTILPWSVLTIVVGSYIQIILTEAGIISTDLRIALITAVAIFVVAGLVFVAARDLLRLEQARRSAEQKLVRQMGLTENRNRLLEQYNYIASHDLREPLGTITGLIALLRESSISLDADSQEILSMMDRSLNRMRGLITGLLDYGRLGRHSLPSQVDLRILIQEVMEDLHADLQSSRALVCLDTLPTIQGLSLELHLLFQNIIANSIKFRDPHRACHLWISAAEESDQYRFQVRDNGIGFDPNQAENLFLLFSRLHPASEYPGLGLGLAHCQRIVELHGGQIFAQSQPGFGTTIGFSLAKTSGQP